MAVTAVTSEQPGARSAGRPGPSRARLVVAATLPLLLLALWGAMLATSGQLTTGVQVGDSAPSFALADLEGRPLRLDDLRGRPVIVNFWASWCRECVEEFPMLERALDAHRGEGLVVVGIVYQDNSEAARDFMTRMGAGWPAAMDPGDETARRFGIYAPPETFFIDPDGMVAGHQIGLLTVADLDRQLALILGKE